MIMRGNVGSWGGGKKEKMENIAFKVRGPGFKSRYSWRSLGPICGASLISTSRTPERKESLKRLEIRFVKSSAQWLVHRRPLINRTTITIAQTKAVYIHDYYKIIIIIKLKHHSYIVCNIFGSESTSLIIWQRQNTKVNTPCCLYLHHSNNSLRRIQNALVC